MGNNTHRRLSVEEFRGFALTDPYAPLIFVNPVRMRNRHRCSRLLTSWRTFGLAGKGSPASRALLPSGTEVEDWCNRAAAELLAPTQEVRARWSVARREANPFEALARAFKVSPVVAARRALDLNLVSRNTFFAFYESYVNRERSGGARSTGGDFYNNQNTRVGELFAVQVLYAAMEGRIGFKEAYDLTGLRGGTFQKYAKRLGVDLP